MFDPDDETRRQFLRLTGVATVASVAGCSGGGGGDTGGVPEEYATATSQGGQERDPENLQTKESLNYQSSPKNDQRCSGCQFYIPDKNGDGLGACTLVEETIDPEGWCVSYSAYQQ